MNPAATSADPPEGSGTPPGRDEDRAAVPPPAGGPGRGSSSAIPGPGQPAAGGDEDALRTPARSTGAWADGLGRAGSRAAQILLVAAVGAGLAWVLMQVKVVVVAVLVALILASAVSPLVRWLAGRGWTNLWATLTAFLGILALLAALITGVVVAIRHQWETLVVSAREGWEELQRFVTAGPLPVDTAAVDAVVRQLTGFLSSEAFAGGAISGLSAATEFLTGTLLMIVILFFFLKDGSKMWNFTLRWVRGRTRAKLAESIDRSAQVLGGYVRGTAVVAAVDAVFIGLPLAVLGVPLALPLAVIVFLGAFIPIVGATVAGILAALVALVTNGPLIALVVVGVVVLVNQVEGDLLQPVVMGRTLSLHAIVVLLALAVGTIVGGIFGAILAVPYTAVAWAVIQVWTDRYQTGDDPVLGPDPLSPQNRVAAKATMAQRWKYQRMRHPYGRWGRRDAAARSWPATEPEATDD